MSTSSYNKDLQLDVSTKQILKLTLPISFAILVPQINFITNNIFLGHYSEKALAIAGLTGVYYLVFSAIGFGLNNGLQALIARRAGENRPEEIGKLFNQAIFIGLAIATIGILLTWLITPYLFALFIDEPDRLQQAVQFSQIRIWGLPFLYVYQMRNALLVGTNQSRYLVIGTLAETITNIVLDYLLIFGHAGLPEMGLNGAAIASIIAEFTGMAVIFFVIHRKGIGARFRLFKDFKWDPANLKLILSLSSPLILQHAISVMSWEYFFLLIDSHGEMALAISNIMRNVFGLFGVITWAFAATTNAMVSNIIGQNKPEEVWHLLRKIIRICTGLALVIALLVNLFPHLILSIYGQSGDFVEQAVPVIRVVSVAMVLMSFAIVFSNAVLGTGNSRITLLIEIAAITFYSIYVYLVLGKYFLSITYGWMSEWLYWITLFLPSFLYMRSGKWKGKVL
ncbi:MAG: MATE family efflux transporter [Chitinophagaceae bacterium]